MRPVRPTQREAASETTPAWAPASMNTEAYRDYVARYNTRIVKKSVPPLDLLSR